MEADKKYCMSSFLMFRTIADSEKCFKEGITPRLLDGFTQRKGIHDSTQLEEYLRTRVERAAADGKMALALSGGIDSAILAKFMPRGSVAYTFKCVVPGIEVVDETKAAAEYARACGLEHRVVEIYWEDFEKYAPLLMRHKGMPVHSIEVQIYKAALRAKEEGMDGFIFGETADALYGGLNGLLSKDWLIGEFIDRYTYVKPYHVLREAELILEPYFCCLIDGYVDVHKFMSGFFYKESLNSYVSALETAGTSGIYPYAETYLAEPLNYARIRSGENKYLVREVFNRLYPGWSVPKKTPMPRPMNEWFQSWTGPVRQEFIPHCTDHMTGDQKWLVWCLEKFLDLCEER